jgi:hypothetical protein
MPAIHLLCPVCNFPIEGPDDATDETIVTCTNTLTRHSFKFKDAMDQMAERVEAKYTADIESVFKKGEI